MDGLDRTDFGGEPGEADALLALTLAGRKTATCWAARWGELTHVGKRALLCDSAGRGRAIVETTSLELRRFCDVDERWARQEGEGDLSLRHWRRAHQAFFEREGHFAEDMDLWCEQFRIVELLPAAD
jgi:uncharacterized protein YhfF